MHYILIHSIHSMNQKEKKLKAKLAKALAKPQYGHTKALSEND